MIINHLNILYIIIILNLRIEKEVNLIICTPIPRLDSNNLYKGNCIHDTKNMVIINKVLLN